MIDKPLTHARADTNRIVLYAECFSLGELLYNIMQGIHHIKFYKGKMVCTHSREGGGC
jgi:hypothetical protein